MLSDRHADLYREVRRKTEALLEAGMTVVVISPNQVKNLRGRYGSASNKDDRFDAFVLADTLRTDRPRLRPLTPDSEATVALRVGVTELGPPSSAAHGADALRRLMAAAESPTAIVTGSIQITRGALDAAHHDRLVVPGKLSVVGFGDEPGFSWWGAGLTTVAFPMHDIATACGVWLLHRLAATAADSAQAAPYTSVSPGTFVERGSTAPPATRPADRQRKAKGGRL